MEDYNGKWIQRLCQKFCIVAVRKQLKPGVIRKYKCTLMLDIWSLYLNEKKCLLDIKI